MASPASSERLLDFSRKPKGTHPNHTVLYVTGTKCLKASSLKQTLNVYYP